MKIRADVRIYSGIFLVILAALAVIIFFIAKSKPAKPITGFEECVAAGYQVKQILSQGMHFAWGRSFCGENYS